MGQFEKFLKLILSGNSDNNIKFKDLRATLLSFGFEERIKGSHHIYTKNGVPTMLNLQKDGDMAKAYQVKQVRKMILENFKWGKYE